MKKFFYRIRRFFWSWGFLKFVLWTLTVIVLFYVEEDWRGARTWAATKADWEAKGESLDFAKFIPKPVPDEQNLGALPIFKMESSGEDKKFKDCPALRQALSKAFKETNEPPLGNWQQGDGPDFSKLNEAVGVEYEREFKGSGAARDSLGQLDALFPFLAELREAAATRPTCHFAFDDSSDMPASRSLGLITSQMKVARLLTLHAILALHQNQADMALSDVKTIYKLLPGVEEEPTLVGSLETLGMSALAGNAIYEGLEFHLWNDAQLGEIQNLLAQPDFLALYQFSLRGEAAGLVLTLNYFNEHRREIRITGWLSYSDWDWTKHPPTFAGVAFNLFPIWPDGWMEINKSQCISYNLDSIRAVDPKMHRAFPEIASKLDGEILKLAATPQALYPWNFIFVDSSYSLASQSESLKFALGQVKLDEMRIACALERYHLAHGVYPGELKALVPDCISELPHDVINGEPYRYQLKTDGSFALYSVGWNQTDDGGAVVYEKNNPKRVDYKQGDWAWPTPQATPDRSP